MIFHGMSSNKVMIILRGTGNKIFLSKHGAKQIMIISETNIKTKVINDATYG